MAKNYSAFVLFFFFYFFFFWKIFFGKGFFGFFALLLSLELICSIVSFDFFFFFLIRIYPKFRGEKCIRTRFWGRIFF